MKSVKIKLLFSVLLSVICLTAVFTVQASPALADEGANVTDNTTVYYDEDGNVIDNPFDADVCFDADGNIIPCPVEDEGSDNSTDTDPTGTKPIPPGQLVRRGLSGPIVATGDGYFVVETNFGLVKVFTTGDVDESMIGHRVAVKLSNRERTTAGTDNISDNASDNATPVLNRYYREADAEQFTLIPTRATREHKWGTIESTNEGCFFVDDEGNQVPVDCSNTTDMIGLFGTGGNATGNGPVLLRIQQASKIRERIQARIDKAEASGDQKTMERLRIQLDRYEQKEQQRQEKNQARIAVRENKAKGKPEDKGNSENTD